MFYRLRMGRLRPAVKPQLAYLSNDAATRRYLLEAPYQKLFSKATI